jgi:hypothetical protein
VPIGVRISFEDALAVAEMGKYHPIIFAWSVPWFFKNTTSFADYARIAVPVNRWETTQAGWYSLIDHT